MNTIGLIGLLVIAACFALTMVSLRRWDDELRAFRTRRWTCWQIRRSTCPGCKSA